MAVWGTSKSAKVTTTISVEARSNVTSKQARHTPTISAAGKV